MTIKFKAIEFPTAHEASQWAHASGRGAAMLLNGRNYVAAQAEIDRLAAAGVEFAYLCDHALPDGTFRSMTVPING